MYRGTGRAVGVARGRGVVRAAGPSTPVVWRRRAVRVRNNDGPPTVATTRQKHGITDRRTDDRLRDTGHRSEKFTAAPRARTNRRDVKIFLPEKRLVEIFILQQIIFLRNRIKIIIFSFQSVRLKTVFLDLACCGTKHLIVLG